MRTAERPGEEGGRGGFENDGLRQERRGRGLMSKLNGNCQLSLSVYKSKVNERERTQEAEGKEKGKRLWKGKMEDD